MLNYDQFTYFLELLNKSAHDIYTSSTHLFLIQSVTTNFKCSRLILVYLRRVLFELVIGSSRLIGGLLISIFISISFDRSLSLFPFQTLDCIQDTSCRVH